MPLDTDLIAKFQSQAPKMPVYDPMGNYAKMLALQNAQQENQMGGMKLAQARQAQADEQTMRRMGTAITPELLESEGLFSQANELRKRKAEALKSQQDVDAKNLSMGKDRVTMQKEIDDMIAGHGSAVLGIKDPAVKQAYYATLRPKFSKYGVNLPEQYPGDAAIQPLVDQAIGKQLALENAKPNTNALQAFEVNGKPGVIQRNPKAAQGYDVIPGLKPIPSQNVNMAMATPAMAGSSDVYAERLVKGLEPWPGTVSIRTDPVVREGVQKARQMDPEFNASTHAQRQKTYQAFTTGKQGDTINALNTGMGHLGELSDLAEQLSNTDYQAVNRAKNAVKKQTGDPVITAFDTTKKAVADEVTRVWRGTGGSEKDVQEALANLDAANSPAQLRANIAQLTRLMASKQKALEDQYRKGMGKFGELEVLDEEAMASLAKIQKRAGGKHTQPSEKQSPGKPATKVNPADGKTYYLHTDGKYYSEKG